MQEERKEVKYSIQGMDCADCALSLERSLAQIQGVELVNVNFTTGQLEAQGTFDPQKLVQRVEALGYTPYFVVRVYHGSLFCNGLHDGHNEKTVGEK